MPKFDYVQPASLAEAVDLLNEPGRTSRVLAGGTDVLVYLRQQAPWFDRLVDISRLPELKRLEQHGDQIHLGAALTFAQAGQSDLLNRIAPMLAQACLSVGSPQIRNLGTLGGNVANAAACADTLPPLVCLEAVAHLAGPHGGRQLPVAEFVTWPNQTTLQPGELLTHFTFTAPPAGVRTAFSKLGRRNAQSISRLSMAAMGRVNPDNVIDFVRLTPGAATPRTARMAGVEALLLGRPLSAELLAEVGAKTAALMVEITGRRWSTEYKEIAIAALAERTLRQVLFI